MNFINVQDNDDNDDDNAEIWNLFEENRNTLKQSKYVDVNSNFSTKHGCVVHSDFLIDYSSGTRICGKCGVIVQNKMIDQEAEWRNLDSNNQYTNDPIRCAIINPLLPNSSLSTKIVTRGKENSHLSRLNRWQSMPHNERSVYEVFQELDSKGRTNNVSNAILLSAKQFYLRVYQKNSALLLKGEKREGLRGGKRKGLIAACLYYAHKQNNMPRSQSQIAEILDYKKSDVTRGCNIFLNLIKNDDDLKRNINDIIDGHYFVRNFGMMLQLDYSLIKHSISVYDMVKKMGILSGNTPPSIASGCLYLVLECLCPGIHESLIATGCGISKVTVLNVFKQLLPYKLRLLTFIFINQYCHKLQIGNKVIIDKIHKLGKTLSYTKEFDTIKPQVLAATVIYYVITQTTTNISVRDSFKLRFWDIISPWGEKHLVECGKKMVFYQDDIKQNVLDYPIFPKSIRKDMRIKSIIATSTKRSRTLDDEYVDQNTTTTIAIADQQQKGRKLGIEQHSIEQHSIDIEQHSIEQHSIEQYSNKSDGSVEDQQITIPDNEEPKQKKRKYTKKIVKSQMELLSDLGNKYLT
jgi:transcription initiation factor TFIIB